VAVRVIPVLDLVGGRAVRARLGQRTTYAPAGSVLAPAAAPGDALALARAFREVLGLPECYVADLDAITGGAPQRPLLRQLAELGGPLLVDAGVATPARARDTLADGAARVVVGLETLPSVAALAAVVRAVGGERVVFGLDLRAGRPLTTADRPPATTPLALARLAVAAGVGALLVLDLARVGSGRGVDLALVRALRRSEPAVELLAGGGVASATDVADPAAAGADAVLVASALHDGRLGRTEIAALRQPDPPRRGSHWSSDSR
jgi:phosphoribosylformimino-5-aminoimidazole carboxamide ribotide isomerase